MSTRLLSVSLAAVLLAILSLANILTPLMPAGPPPLVVYALIGLGVLGLMGALGLWMLQRWALWMTIVVSVINILAAAPGLVFAPKTISRVLATIGVVGFAPGHFACDIARPASSVQLTNL